MCLTYIIKIMITLDRNKTVALTGHRPKEMLSHYQTDIGLDQIRSDTAKQILNFYRQGYNTFLSDMTQGFGLLAAEIVLSLRGQCPDIRLIPVILFHGHERRYNKNDRRRYADILVQTDQTIVLAACFSKDCFLNRNRYMLDIASHLIVYWTGKQNGETYYIVCEALNRQIPIHNIYLIHNI